MLWLGTLAPHGGAIQVRLEFAATGPPGVTDIAIPLVVNEQASGRLRVLGRVIRQQLLLLQPGTDAPLDFLDLGQFYYGTNRTLKATLFNDRPCPTSFFFHLRQQRAWVYTANGRESCPDFCAQLNTVSIEPKEGELHPMVRSTAASMFSRLPSALLSLTSQHAGEANPPNHRHAASTQAGYPCDRRGTWRAVCPSPLAPCTPRGAARFPS